MVFFLISCLFFLRKPVNGQAGMQKDGKKNSLFLCEKHSYSGNILHLPDRQAFRKKKKKGKRKKN